MKIRQLEYFVSVARHLSFTKAAQECYTAQSAVSQQITMLEEELGFALFERNTKRVTLTRAGESYYLDTMRLLQLLKENHRRAALIATGADGFLRVGLCGANQSVHLTGLKRFIREHPNVRLTFCAVDTARQMKELMEGKYDILYTACFNMVNEESDIAFVGQQDYELGVYMNEEHPLAMKKDIELEALAECVNIFAAQDDSVRLMSTETDLYGSRNMKPRKIEYVQDQNISVLLLEFNMGVAIAPVELVPTMPKGVVLRTLEGGRHHISLGWAYRTGNPNPALHRLIAFLHAEKAGSAGENGMDARACGP